MEELKSLKGRTNELEALIKKSQLPPELMAAMSRAAQQGVIQALQKMRQNSL